MEPSCTTNLGTEGKSVFQIERDLLKQFGRNREYVGTIEDGYSLIRYLDQVTTAPYNASNCVYGTRELLSLYTRHLYVKAPSARQQLLTNYEHENKRPKWVARARNILIDDVHGVASLSGLPLTSIMTQSTIHVWSNAIAVICMLYGEGNVQRNVRTSVVRSDGSWLTSTLCAYTKQVDDVQYLGYIGFRIVGQDVILPCPIL